jgi:phage FluMu protein Com
MPICPRCHKEIDHLHVNVTEEYTKSYAGGNGIFDEIDQISCTFSDWRCPECDFVLPITDQDAADKFLAS